jgi:NADPH:quinone reductase-like Zn-dependent oxidoreductase
VQLAHAAGARVFATASGDKRDAVLGFGADVCIDYRSEDFQTVVAQATDGKGVDVVIDFVGAPYLEANVRSLAVGGRMVCVGLLGGAANATLPMDAVLYRHLKIFGTVMKSRTPEVKQAMVQRFAKQWLPALEAGTIRPVIDRRFALADAAQAHQHMESGANIGKILLLPAGTER